MINIGLMPLIMDGGGEASVSDLTVNTRSKEAPKSEDRRPLEIGGWSRDGRKTVVLGYNRT